MGMLLFIQSLFAEYSESPISNISYLNIGDKKSIDYRNVLFDKENLIMRASANEGSMINFKNTSPTDEFSFEFKVGNPRFMFPESGGIYFWYTKDKLQSGSFHGAKADLIFMAGIEFTGSNVIFVIGSNKGDHEFNDLEDVLLRDNTNPNRFRYTEEFTIKIIKTSKNFKIEVREGENMLYDKLRFVNTAALGEVLSGGYVSVSSDYRKVSSEKHLVIKDLKLYDRKETDLYDPYKYTTFTPLTEPRSSDMVNHPSEEIQHLISNMEHFMAWMKILLGEPSGTPIAQNISDARLEVFSQKEDIQKLSEKIEKITSSDYSNDFSKLLNKVGNLKESISTLQSDVYRLTEKLNSSKAPSTTRTDFLLLILLMIMAVFIFLQFAERKHRYLSGFKVK